MSVFDGESVRERLLSWHDRYVVYGNTHDVGKGKGWVNSGAWTHRGVSANMDGPNTYIDIKDGNVEVWQWYRNKSDKKLFD